METRELISNHETITAFRGLGIKAQVNRFLTNKAPCDVPRNKQELQRWRSHISPLRRSHIFNRANSDPERRRRLACVRSVWESVCVITSSVLSWCNWPPAEQRAGKTSRAPSPWPLITVKVSLSVWNTIFSVPVWKYHTHYPLLRRYFGANRPDETVASQNNVVTFRLCSPNIMWSGSSWYENFLPGVTEDAYSQSGWDHPGAHADNWASSWVHRYSMCASEQTFTHTGTEKTTHDAMIHWTVTCWSKFLFHSISTKGKYQNQP